ncbi:hypothetical protein [Paenibacillus hexagrammi]|uniref:Uncharacterized protein n=1 Tax=Paenibacillus hexagrammi TaxID=2908839 RepID=A0ABY3SHN2_9BACL|nr:hypothetical protein [Paenibacillus sp. YPD9-1]UJF33547.1 hypothetical protein L0M14_29300 [Paenibacillus sp. YPD9-1]
MRPDTIRVLNLIQLISEMCIAVGYLVGLIPFMYMVSCNWVLPLVFVSAIIAWLVRNGTTNMAVINIVLSFLSFIPVVGYVFRVGGILVSWMNIRRITGGQGRY